jgi:mono/diheme cytochrome c family protein
MLRLLFVVIGMAIALAGCNTMRPVAAEDDPAKPAFYTDKVKPILAANCAQCHLGTAHKGGLNMGTKAGMLKGGRDGVVLIPGDPSKSLLVTLMRHEGPTDDPMPMPPSPRPKVSDADIATVARWVKAGAVFPADQ